MNELIKILEPNLVFDSKNIDRADNKLTIRVHMGTDGAACPYCGTWSDSVQGRYTRTLNDFAVMGTPTDIIVDTRKFYCSCEECGHKTFAEPLPFAERYSRKTDRAWQHVDELHLAMSAAEAAEIVSDSLFPIHHSTLIRHLSRRAADIEPNRAVVVAMCLDDLALRKRHSYATAFIDAETHELLDMIPSRRSDDVKEELSRYLGLQLVCRDGAHCFRESVLKLEDGDLIIQVVDRFHVLMKCTEAAAKYLKARLPENLPLTGPVEKRTTAPLTEAAQNRKTRIITVQQLRESGMSVKQIAADQGLSDQTVRSYLKADPDSMPSGNKQKFQKLIPYIKKIGELMSKGVSVKNIYREIQERGCQCSRNMLYEYVRKRKDGIVSVPTEDSLSRAELLKRLYKPLEEIPTLDEKDYNRALELYPFVAEVFEWVDQLRALMASKDASGLDEWIDDSRKFTSGAINSFVNGLLRERKAVEECIELPFSNGPTEGTVGKIKVLRRIMYGRCRFEFFRLKVLAKERIRRARQARLKAARQARSVA